MRPVILKGIISIFSTLLVSVVFLLVSERAVSLVSAITLLGFFTSVLLANIYLKTRRKNIVRELDSNWEETVQAHRSLSPLRKGLIEKEYRLARWIAEYVGNTNSRLKIEKVKKDLDLKLEEAEAC